MFGKAGLKNKISNLEIDLVWYKEAIELRKKRIKKVETLLRGVLSKNKILPIEVKVVPEFCTLTIKISFNTGNMTREVTLPGFRMGIGGEPYRQEQFNSIWEVEKEYGLIIHDYEYVAIEKKYHGEKTFVKVSMEKGDIKRFPNAIGYTEEVESSIIGKWQEIK